MTFRDMALLGDLALGGEARHGVKDAMARLDMTYGAGFDVGRHNQATSICTSVVHRMIPSQTAYFNHGPGQPQVDGSLVQTPDR